MNKIKLQPELVLHIERLPIAVKAEKINVDKLNDYSSEDEDNNYLIEEFQNEVNFFLKRRVKTKPTITDSEEEEPLSTFKNSKCNANTIKEEYFIKSEVLVQEELDIKDEDEETIKDENLVASEIIVQEELHIKDEDETEDQFTAKSAIEQVKKQHHPGNGTTVLDRTSSNNRRFRLAEPSVFKCFDCTYETHQKQNIARHALNHMEKIYKCSHCSYKTSDKYCFKRHELIHVPKEQAKLYQCPECSYTSIRKGGLTEHLIKHKKPSDVKWHKCTLCCYESSHKSNLTQHLKRVHRPKDIQPIHCQEEGCSFKTHYEPYLVRHISVIHKCKTFFKCSKCSYKTKYGNDFKAHELRHEDPNKWFSCTLCSYKVINKCYLKRHMLVHKSGSEIQWFQCSECSFKTKHKNSLRVHKLIHILNPEKIFSCLKCSYKTVHARRYREHGLAHKNPEEISEWFYCHLCTFRTSRKRNLRDHIQKMHRGSNGRINDRTCRTLGS